MGASRRTWSRGLVRDDSGDGSPTTGAPYTPFVAGSFGSRYLRIRKAVDRENETVRDSEGPDAGSSHPERYLTEGRQCGLR